MSFQEKSVLYWELVIDTMAIIEGLLPNVNTKTANKIADDLIWVTRRIDSVLSEYEAPSGKSGNGLNNQSGKGQGNQQAGFVSNSESFTSSDERERDIGILTGLLSNATHLVFVVYCYHGVEFSPPTSTGSLRKAENELKLEETGAEIRNLPVKRGAANKKFVGEITGERSQKKYQTALPDSKRSEGPGSPELFHDNSGGFFPSSGIISGTAKSKANDSSRMRRNEAKKSIEWLKLAQFVKDMFKHRPVLNNWNMVVAMFTKRLKQELLGTSCPDSALSILDNFCFCLFKIDYGHNGMHRDITYVFDMPVHHVTLLWFQFLHLFESQNSKAILSDLLVKNLDSCFLYLDYKHGILTEFLDIGDIHTEGSETLFMGITQEVIAEMKEQGNKLSQRRKSTMIDERKRKASRKLTDDSPEREIPRKEPTDMSQATESRRNSESNRIKPGLPSEVMNELDAFRQVSPINSMESSPNQNTVLVFEISKDTNSKFHFREANDLKVKNFTAKGRASRNLELVMEAPKFSTKLLFSLFTEFGLSSPSISSLIPGFEAFIRMVQMHVFTDSAGDVSKSVLYSILIDWLEKLFKDKPNKSFFEEVIKPYRTPRFTYYFVRFLRVCLPEDVNNLLTGFLKRVKELLSENMKNKSHDLESSELSNLLKHLVSVSGLITETAQLQHLKDIVGYASSLHGSSLSNYIFPYLFSSIITVLCDETALAGEIKKPFDSTSFFTAKFPVEILQKRSLFKFAYSLATLRIVAANNVSSIFGGEPSTETRPPGIYEQVLHQLCNVIQDSSGVAWKSPQNAGSPRIGQGPPGSSSGGGAKGTKEVIGASPSSTPSFSGDEVNAIESAFYLIGSMSMAILNIGSIVKLLVERLFVRCHSPLVRNYIMWSALSISNERDLRVQQRFLASNPDFENSMAMTMFKELDSQSLWSVTKINSFLSNPFGLGKPELKAKTSSSEPKKTKAPSPLPSPQVFSEASNVYFSESKTPMAEVAINSVDEAWDFFQETVSPEKHASHSKIEVSEVGVETKCHYADITETNPRDLLEMNLGISEKFMERIEAKNSKLILPKEMQGSLLECIGIIYSKNPMDSDLKTTEHYQSDFLSVLDRCGQRLGMECGGWQFLQMAREQYNQHDCHYFSSKLQKMMFVVLNSPGVSQKNINKALNSRQWPVIIIWDTSKGSKAPNCLLTLKRMGHSGHIIIVSPFQNAPGFYCVRYIESSFNSSPD